VFNTKIVPEFADGNVVSVLAISRDITDIKEVETKLKETLDNLENLVEERTAELETAFNSLKESEKGLAEAQRMAQIGNWEWDIATDKAFWSEEMYHIYGLNPQDPAPGLEEFLNYIKSDDRDYVVDALKKDPKGEPLFIDFRIITTDGEERTVHMLSEIIFYKENTPVRFRGTVQDITERIKSEEKIRNLANIVESSNDAIITKSLDGIITSWNKGAEQVYGYSAEEVLGKPISIMAPTHSDTEGKKLTEMIKQGERIHHYETSRLRKDGKLIDVSLNLSPVFDSSGRLTAISVIARDITERKKIEEKLRESEEKYRSIVETAKEGIVIIDEEAIITYTNKRLADLLGYTRGEGIGRLIWDFISEESKDIMKLNLKNRCLDTHGSYELKLIKRDGSALWVLVNAKPLFDKSGKSMGSMSMLTDITEIKKAEMELKENESRFRNLFEVITSGVAIFDVIDHGHDFIFKDMNPACGRIFHVKRESIIGKSLYEIFPDADKMGLNEAFRWVWAAGQQEFLPLTLNVDKNITSWLTANVFRLPSGELVAVFEDITERKQAFEEREQLLDYILQEKDRLVALVNSITDEVWFADTHKNFTLINPSALNEFNIIDEGEITAGKLPASLEVYRPDGSLRPIGEAPSLRALRGEIVKNQEEIVRTPVYGELRYRQVSASPVHDTCGNIIGSVSVVRDITENKRAEAALHKSEEQYRTLFSTMNEGFCIIEMLFDENGKPFDYIFVETNPSFEKQTGLSNVVGKRIRELILANQAVSKPFRFLQLGSTSFKYFFHFEKN
jgi:PAS domain S-box-containing protein